MTGDKVEERRILEFPDHRMAPPEDPATRLARKLTEAIEEYVESRATEARDEMRTEIEELHHIINQLEQGDPYQ